MGSAVTGVTKFQKMTRANPTTVIIAGVGNGNELKRMRAFWPEARLIGCEPLPDTHRHVRRGAWKQSARRRDFFRVALGGSSRSNQTLHCNYSPDQRASLFGLLDAELPNEITRTVDVITLDELHEKTKPWGERVLIWLDTEGAEKEILEAATVSLENVQWLNVELSMIPARVMPAWDATNAVLRDKGFRCCAVHSMSRDGRMVDGVYIRDEDWDARRRDLVELSIERKKWRQLNSPKAKRALAEKLAAAEAEKGFELTGGRRRRRRRRT